MPLALLGIGTAVPSGSYDQREGLLIAQSLCCRTQEQATWLPTMYEHTGIGKRHLCLGRDLVDDVIQGTEYSQSPFLPTRIEDDQGPTLRERMQMYAEQAPLLSRQACGRALERSRLEARAITHLVTVSCTEFYAPGWDVTLVRDLGLPLDTQRTHIGFMGCHGALNGLRVARAFVEADANAKVLLCATELCSIHYHYGWDPQKVIANAIFADGAAALVGARADPATRTWRLAASGSYLVPGTENAMTWELGNHGFSMTLAKNIPDIIAKNLRRYLAPWLAQNGLSIPAIRSWAIHPGGPKILEAAAGALEIYPALLEPAQEVFTNFGNMSSPTVLFVLDHLQQQKCELPCVALGFGPGLNVEAALFL